MAKKTTTPKQFDPQKNYLATMKAIGYVSRSNATPEDYRRIGFKSGLEVHQQLKTQKKLFCRCPAGIFHENEDFHAEIIRHMRPTLSEMGEYDGTALMEFKTKKEVIYRINNKTTCTYEIDDTPPFPVNREALEIALEISLLCKMSIVGEVHITRKQYLDGSIPTGFQRTAILGVGGELQLKKKKINLIQLSIEEDACREISDIGHQRIYKTDRLGMPLIETVTHPECLTPDELREAGDYIRFLNRSTGKVRTGIGAARQDTNVSCEGGTRVEIKGVSHSKWLPELSHIECFRQWALLNIRKMLLERVANPASWALRHMEIDAYSHNLEHELAQKYTDNGYKLVAVALPAFHGILSHFTQPGMSFTNELSDRLKVIACVEKPNITSDEDLVNPLSEQDTVKLASLLKASADDAIVLIWGPKEDIPTALDVIDERCRMAFEGVPRETRRPLADGTTLFERVLPGADRMYPDTDSAPIPLEDSYIKKLSGNLPVDIWQRFQQLANMRIPEDTHRFILRRNLVPIIEEISNMGFSARFVGTLLGHNLRCIEGHIPMHKDFNYRRIVEMFAFLSKQKLHQSLSKLMLPVIYQHPNMDFNSVLTSINFKKRTVEELSAPVDYLIEKFKEIRVTKGNNPDIVVNWVMGQLNRQALGNADLKELRKRIEERVNS